MVPRVAVAVVLRVAVAVVLRVAVANVVVAAVAVEGPFENQGHKSTA